MTYKLFTVDAFTDEVFKGNPAGVCVTQTPISEVIMQQIAMELNLSETAFVVPEKNNEIKSATAFSLRWFTPTTEVDLCGHGTLAASHVLYHEYGYQGQSITFNTKSGELTATLDSGMYVMNFPQSYGTPVEIPPEIHGIFNISAGNILQCVFCNQTGNLLIEFSSEEIVRAISPDFQKMIALDVPYDLSGILITATSNRPEIDITSRCFFPLEGIPEDPVTGSAHTDLGPYWAPKLDKFEMTAYQASRRGGMLFLKLLGDGRILIKGLAITVLSGNFSF